MAKPKFPTTMGACIDLAYKLRAERILAQREMEEKIEALKERENAIREHLITTFKKSDLNGAKGKLASVSLKPATYPQPKDWPAIYKYIVKEDAFDLLEKRIHKTAYRDRLEAGVVIPGIDRFDTMELSLTKIGDKE